MKGAGIVVTAVSAVGLIFSILQIVTDKTGRPFGYTYTPPFTPHEITMLSLLGAAIVGIIVGVILWVKGAKS